jgi:quercetin 2,3-dioxygenase
MKVRKSHERGVSELDWLSSRFSFSFAEYYDPQNMGFGALRVINDDKIAPSGGFGSHPHRDMEIITIVTKGKLEHQDSMGFKEILDDTKIQYMSAGSGIKHSEFNASQTQPLELFQIWIKPDKQGYEPTYKSVNIKPTDYDGKFLKIAGGYGDELILIRQKAIIYRGVLDAGSKVTLKHKENNMGWYMLLINGKIDVSGVTLQDKDACMFENDSDIEIEIVQKSDILLFDVALI